MPAKKKAYGAWVMVKGPSGQLIRRYRRLQAPKKYSKKAPIKKKIIKEANVKACEYLRKHPTATARELATGIACAPGLVLLLPIWKRKELARQRKELAWERLLYRHAMRPQPALDPKADPIDSALTRLHTLVSEARLRLQLLVDSHMTTVPVIYPPSSRLLYAPQKPELFAILTAQDMRLTVAPLASGDDKLVTLCERVLRLCNRWQKNAPRIGLWPKEDKETRLMLDDLRWIEEKALSLSQLHGLAARKVAVAPAASSALSAVTAGNVSHVGYFSPADLARIHGVNYEALRKRLGRWRKHHADSYICLDKESLRKSTEAKHLYKVTDVMPVIEDMKKPKKSSSKMSGNRPA